MILTNGSGVLGGEEGLETELSLQLVPDEPDQPEEVLVVSAVEIDRDELSRVVARPLDVDLERIQAEGLKGSPDLVLTEILGEDEGRFGPYHGSDSSDGAD